MQFKINDILSYDIFGIICFPNSNMKNLIIDDHVIHIWTECRFTNGSRSLGLVGFAASRNKADARHYDLPYLYNPQQVAVVLAIQAIQLKIVISWSCLQLRPQDTIPTTPLPLARIVNSSLS